MPKKSKSKAKAAQLDADATIVTPDASSVVEASTEASAGNQQPSSSSSSRQASGEMSSGAGGEQWAELNKTLQKLLELQTSSQEAAARRAEEERIERERERKAWRENLETLGNNLSKELRTLSDDVRGTSAEPEPAASASKSASKGGNVEASGPANQRDKPAVADDDDGASSPGSETSDESPETSRDRLVTPVSPVPIIDSATHWAHLRKQNERYAPKGKGGAASHPGGPAAEAAERAAIEAEKADAAAIQARANQAKLEKAARREAREARRANKQTLQNPPHQTQVAQTTLEASPAPFVPYKIELMHGTAVSELTDDCDIEEWYDLMVTQVDCTTWQTDDPTQQEQIRRHALGLIVGRLRGNALKEWQSLSAADKHRLKTDIKAWRELIVEPALPDPTTRRLNADERHWQMSKETFQDYVKSKRAAMVRVRPELGDKANRRELWLIVRRGIRDTEYQIHFSAPLDENPSEYLIKEQMREIDRLVEARAKKGQEKKAKRAAEARQSEAKQDAKDFRNPSRNAGGSRGETSAATSRTREPEVFDPKRMGTKMVEGKKVPTYTRADGYEIVLRRACRHCGKMHPDFACKAVSEGGKNFNLSGGPRWTFDDNDVAKALQDYESESASNSTDGYASAAEEEGFRKGSAQTRH